MPIGKKRTSLATQVLEERKFKTKTKYVALRWNLINGYSFFKVMKQKIKKNSELVECTIYKVKSNAEKS